jgi:hypothetical protein
MEIRIPLVRSHFLVVLVAAVTALIRGKTTLRFSTQEVNGKKRPVILSRDEVARLEQDHIETASQVQLLRDMVEEAIAQMPAEDITTLRLRDGLTMLDKRTIH